MPYKQHSDSLSMHPKQSHEPVIDPRSLVACAEDHANKITTLQTRRGDLACWATETTNSSNIYEANANYTCHSKFGPLQYFTAGVTQYFHTVKRKASEWVPKPQRNTDIAFVTSSPLVFWEISPLRWGFTTCCRPGTGYWSQSCKHPATVPFLWS